MQSFVLPETSRIFFVIITAYPSQNFNMYRSKRRNSAKFYRNAANILSDRLIIVSSDTSDIGKKRKTVDFFGRLVYNENVLKMCMLPNPDSAFSVKFRASYNFDNILVTFFKFPCLI